MSFILERKIYIKKTGYFTKTEIALWCISALTVTVSFFIGGGRDYLNLAASLVGITSLILCAKGNPSGADDSFQHYVRDSLAVVQILW